MTVVKSARSSEVIALPRPETVRVDPGEAIGAPPAPSNSNNLQNVIPFMRPRAADAHAPAVVLPGDVVRRPASSFTRERARLAALVAISLLIHGGLLFAGLWREPEPLASVGLEAISVEIVLGATAPAGAAPTPGVNEVNSVSTPETKPEETDKAEAKATEQAQDVQVAERETAPEVKAEQSQPPKDTADATPESQPAELQAAVAMVETPNGDTATAKPQEQAAPPQDFSMLPQPEEKATEKPVERRPEPAAKKSAPPKPVKDAAPAKERRRIAAPTRDTPAREAKTSTASSQANSIGIGRSNNDSNYPGTVRAHLARYQQQLGSSQGTATVSFTIAGSGAVSGVRLARASGVAAIDSEVQAMVRRASPFPAPPGGTSRSFTVPINFRQN